MKWSVGNDDMNQNRKHIAMAATWRIVQASLFLIGGWIVLFGVVCYLGGPDPRPGDLHLHLIFGTLWTGVGVALLFGGRKAGQSARKASKGERELYEEG